MTQKARYKGDSGIQHEPQTFDAQTGLPEPAPVVGKGKNGRRIRLANARCLRQEMAYLYRLVDRGEMESGEMNKRIWALGEMLKAYVVQDLARDVAELQQQRLLEAG
jgi:hypothetical protein